MPLRPRHRRAFTMIELLIVIGIILVLASILFPVIHHMREQANGVKCQANLRSLWQGLISFAADHDNRLPGGVYDSADPDASHRDWLLGQYGTTATTQWANAPDAGTLWRYMNKSSETYRCPSRTNVAPGAGGASAADDSSNGKFDYAIFLAFTGCPMDKLPQTATVTQTIGGNPPTPVTFPCPILLEKSSAFINNGSVADGAHFTGAHVNTATLSHVHPSAKSLPGSSGGSYYIAADGASYPIDEAVGASPNGNVANDYMATGPRTKVPVSLGAGVQQPTWGWWTHQ